MVVQTGCPKDHDQEVGRLRGVRRLGTRRQPVEPVPLPQHRRQRSGQSRRGMKPKRLCLLVEPSADMPQGSVFSQRRAVARGRAGPPAAGRASSSRPPTTARGHLERTGRRAVRRLRPGRCLDTVKPGSTPCTRLIAVVAPGAGRKRPSDGQRPWTGAPRGPTSRPGGFGPDHGRHGDLHDLERFSERSPRIGRSSRDQRGHRPARCGSRPARYVTLTAATSVTVADRRAVVTIANDD